MWTSKNKGTGNIKPGTKGLEMVLPSTSTARAKEIMLEGLAMRHRANFFLAPKPGESRASVRERKRKGPATRATRRLFRQYLYELNKHDPDEVQKVSREFFSRSLP